MRQATGAASIRSLGLGVALGVLVASCAGAAPAAAPDLSDGVSRSEAERIAARLFGTLVGCGASGKARRVDDSWEVPTRIGYAAVPGPPLRVDVGTGAVRWGDACRVPDPMVLFAEPVSLECEVPPAAP